MGLTHGLEGCAGGRSPADTFGVVLLPSSPAEIALQPLPPLVALRLRTVCFVSISAHRHGLRRACGGTYAFRPPLPPRLNRVFDGRAFHARCSRGARRRTGHASARVYPQRRNEPGLNRGRRANMPMWDIWRQDARERREAVITNCEPSPRHGDMCLLPMRSPSLRICRPCASSVSAEPPPPPGQRLASTPTPLPPCYAGRLAAASPPVPAAGSFFSCV